MKLKLFSFSKKIVIIISVCIILGLGASFFAVWNVYNYKQQLIAKKQKELSINVEIISNGIKKVFNDHYDHLRTIANEPDVIDAFLHQKTHDFSKEYCAIENLFANHQPEMGSITMITTRGKIFHRHPVKTDSIDYSNKDDVAHVLNNKKAYVSDVFVNSENIPSLSISYPVFNKNKFIGIVRATVYLETITNLFVVPFEIKNRKVAILNNHGDFLYHSDEYIINKNYKEIISEYKATFPNQNWKRLEKMMEKIYRKEIGASVFYSVNIETNKIQQCISAFNSVQIFNKTLFVLVSSEYDHVMLATKQYINKFLVFILIIIILFSIVTITLINSNKKRLILLKENEYLKEISDKTNKIKEQRNEYLSLSKDYGEQNVSLDKANAEIEENEKYLNSIFKSAPVGIGVVCNRMLTFVNDRFCKITGYEKEDLINKSSEMIYLDKDEYERVGESKYEQIKKKGTGRIETIFKKKDGELINVLLSLTPIDIDDLSKGVTFSALDITDRKKAEEKLQKKEDLLNNIQELTMVGGWEWNVVKQTMNWTNETFRIHEIIPDSIEAGFAEHIKQSVKCYEPADRPKILEAFNNCVEKGIPYDLEFPFTTDKGKKKWIRTRAKAIKEKDNIVRVLGNIMDITERKHSEISLNREKEFSEQIINTSSAIIVGLDKDHIIRIFNEGAERITGYKEDEVIGRDWFKLFFPPEIIKEMNKVWKNAWGVSTHAYINQILTKNKEERIISWQTTGFYKEKVDKYNLLISIGEDITERVKAEKNLAESKETQDKILGAFNDGTYLCSANYEIKYLNPAMKDKIGYDATGEKCYKAIYNSNEICSWCYFNELKDKKKSKTTIEVESDNRFYTVTSVLLKDKSKLTVYHDITSRKQAELALIESEAKFKMLFNTANDAVFLFNRKGEFIEVNDEAVRRYGYSKKEFLGMNPYQLSPPDLEMKTKKEIDTVFRSERRQFIHKHKKADGTIFPAEISTRKIIYNNETVFLVLVHDISEREKQQQQIFNAVIHAEEKERSRISRDIHDGVSPMLSALKIYIQSLKKHKDREIIDEIHNRIELTIDETIESISEISNNLSPHILRNFGLTKAIESFCNKVKKFKDLKVNIKTDNIDDLEINTETTLYRVTTELINNTLKHSEASKISIKIIKGLDVEYVYTDNGQGFDIETINSKGMGLFNLSNRIQFLKGSINFINKKGVKVVIRIPLN